MYNVHTIKIQNEHYQIEQTASQTNNFTFWHTIKSHFTSTCSYLSQSCRDMYKWVRLSITVHSMPSDAASQGELLWAAGVLRPSGTRDTWRRRWKGWYSCSRTPVPRWSGRTRSKSRHYRRTNSRCCRADCSTSRRWIHSKSSVTSPRRCVLLRSRLNWLLHSPEIASTKCSCVD